MTVKGIVAKYLRENDYDGLFNESGECACLLTDLEPCSEISSECCAGYKVPCNCGKGHMSFHVVKEKP